MIYRSTCLRRSKVLWLQFWGQALLQIQRSMNCCSPTCCLCSIRRRTSKASVSNDFSLNASYNVRRGDEIIAQYINMVHCDIDLYVANEICLETFEKHTNKPFLSQIEGSFQKRYWYGVVKDRTVWKFHLIQNVKTKTQNFLSCLLKRMGTILIRTEVRRFYGFPYLFNNIESPL